MDLGSADRDSVRRAAGAAGKVPGARGITYHQYNDAGLIQREASLWDIATAAAELGQPVEPRFVTKAPALV